MDEYEILVEEMIPNLRLQILNYSFLVNDSLKAWYEIETLSELNRCRMHLHATCYLTSSQGMEIPWHPTP